MARIAERQADLHRLAALQRRRLLADELQLDLEHAVADLREDPGDPHPDLAAADLGIGDLADRDPAEIEFVDLGAQLVAAGAVELAEPLAALERLADLDREGGELAGDRRAQVERVEAGAGDLEALVQRRGRSAQLGELGRLQPLVGRALAGEHVAAAAVRFIEVAAVGEGAAGDEAALRRAAAAPHIGGAPSAWRARPRSARARC